MTEREVGKPNVLDQLIEDATHKFWSKDTYVNEAGIKADYFGAVDAADESIDELLERTGLSISNVFSDIIHNTHVTPAELSHLDFGYEDWNDFLRGLTSFIVKYEMEDKDSALKNEDERRANQIFPIK